MKQLLSFLFVTFIFTNVFSQKDTLRLADELFYNEDFSAAIQFYKRLISFDPKNPEYYYKLGYCYLNTYGAQDSSIAPLKTSLQLYQTTPKNKLREITVNATEIKFYLAKSYRYNQMFDSAIILFTQLKNEIKNKKQLEYIDNELKICNDSKELIQNKLEVEIINLGPAINTSFTEHTPVISPDETEIFFTSRRQLYQNVEKFFDGEYDENIYFSTKDSNGIWSDAQPLLNINTTDFEATISLSYDGSKLFIYKDEEGGSIYMSIYINGQWQIPIKLGKTINSKSRETHLCLSYDGKTLYFTSDRPGGFGGLDIYMSQLNNDGSWGEAVNLGPAINTSKDEEAPYIMPDGVTLYFSSKGLGGLGGYDIYKSTKNEFGTWGLPQNIGYPINSMDDDVFFFLTPDQQRAYFASKKGNDNYGKTDIYMMKLPDINKSELVVMTGKLAVCSGTLPPADILITDNSNGSQYVATPKNGKFVFVVQRGKSYTVQIETKGKEVFKETFDVPKDAPRLMLYKVVRLDPEVPCTKTFVIDEDEKIDPRRIGPDGTVYDYFVEVENILFPLNQVGNIKPKPSLDTLANYLLRNPDAIIEVGGYCDASGKADYNFILGQKRADAVKDYFIKKGINPKQVIAQSYGEENPIAKNKNKDGSWNPAGQNYNRRVEFRVINQGDETILIRGMKLPDNLKNPNYKFNYVKGKDNLESKD